MKKFLLVMLLFVAGCVQAPPTDQPAPLSQQQISQIKTALDQFETVITRVKPVAETECKRRARGVNCDYLILVDDRLGLQPNAFQSEDKSGRPALIFTLSLLTDVRNADELALITSHEAAHHILGHLQQTRENAALGAALFGMLGAPDLGAEVGARVNSKEFEIQADRLGALIARKAGFDPLRGVAYFTRIPDPGNQFLGTHPPNADRVATIRNASGV